jgi:hypothetical protein
VDKEEKIEIHQMSIIHQIIGIASNSEKPHFSYIYLPPNHNMQNSTEGTFQKHHQEPSVWHLEEEISFLLQATLSAIQGEQ